MKSNLYHIALGSIALLGATETSAEEAKQPNVLFICIDDLRTELGCYGSVVKSPNLDKLASTGSLFTNHYVQVPTSGASRASMLSGLLPDTKADLSNFACRDNFTGKTEEETPITLFHALRKGGYYTVGIGKIGHSECGLKEKGAKETYDSPYEQPHSWDEVLFNHGKWGSGVDSFFGYADGSSRGSMNFQVKPYECGDVDDTGYVDGLTAELALDKLEELSKMDGERPFCLTVGFFKPHLPFNSPKKYWDLYNEQDIEISEYDIPEGVNSAGLHPSGEFNNYKKGDEKPSLEGHVSEEYAKKLRHAYYACVSYTDSQVGKLLDKLKELGLEDNTIVVVWGDHGWNLGDMRVWGKHTIFEPSLRSTLIIRDPNAKKGVKNNRIVSSVDLYPTIMDLCNVNYTTKLDGKSFKTLLTKPKDKNWEECAYSYFNSGITLRTPKYRYTKYFRGAEPTLELFKYKGSGFETKNIASENEDIIKELSPILEMGNKGIYSK